MYSGSTVFPMKHVVYTTISICNPYFQMANCKRREGCCVLQLACMVTKSEEHSKDSHDVEEILAHCRVDISFYQL